MILGQSHCSQSHENTKCFPIVQTCLRFLNHFGGKMLSNYFIFWFSATHLKLTPWPPLTTAKEFHEPGTPLPAVGNSQAWDERPPASRWDLVVRGASQSWDHWVVISPWVRANSHVSLSPHWTHFRGFLKKQTIKLSTYVIHVSHRFLKDPKVWNKLGFPLSTCSYHLTVYQGSRSNLAIAPSSSHSTGDGQPSCQPIWTDVSHNRIKDF